MSAAVEREKMGLASHQQNTGLGAHTRHTASDRMKEPVITRLAVSTIGNRATAMGEWFRASGSDKSVEGQIRMARLHR